MDRGGAAVFAHQCVEHLARLIERAQDDGVARRVDVVAQFHAAFFARGLIEWRQVLGARCIRRAKLAVMAVFGNLRYGFVVAQTRFHQGDDAPQGFEREIGKRAETDAFKRAKAGFGFRQVGDVAQVLCDFVIVFVDTEHAGEFVQQFGVAFQRGRADALPEVFAPGFFKGFAQFVPGGEFDERLLFGVFALAAAMRGADSVIPETCFFQGSFEGFEFDGFLFVRQ